MSTARTTVNPFRKVEFMWSESGWNPSFFVNQLKWADLRRLWRSWVFFEPNSTATDNSETFQGHNESLRLSWCYPGYYAGNLGNPNFINMGPQCVFCPDGCAFFESSSTLSFRICLPGLCFPVGRMIKIINSGDSSRFQYFLNSNFHLVNSQIIFAVRTIKIDAGNATSAFFPICILFYWNPKNVNERFSKNSQRTGGWWKVRLLHRRSLVRAYF